jgi:hypothetical protein
VNSWLLLKTCSRRTKNQPKSSAHILLPQRLLNIKTLFLAGLYREPPPYGLLLFGIFSLFLAVGGILTGEAPARGVGMIDRNKQPKRFWQVIALYLVGGVLLISWFLWSVYGPRLSRK